MPRGRPDIVLNHLRRFAASAAGPTSDARLLERFLEQRDEAAFAALVDRHASLVWNVCRRVLHDDHEAEDAFQAAFVILARKAGAIRRRQSVGSWLYGVAYRLAVRARANAARRQFLARKASVRPAADPLAEVSGRELLHLLDAELQRLPERLRAPLLLCYLEGQSQEEAAEQLGWSKTTLRGRLERGRDLLRRRLSRRSLALPAALFPAALAARADAGPAALAAARAAGGAAAELSPSVLDLVQGMTRTLFLARMRTLALVVMLAAFGAGAVALARHALAEKPTAPAGKDNARALPGEQPTPVVDRFGDPLPAGALARLGTVRMRHGGRVNAVAFFKDGKTAVSGGDDGFVRFWDVGTGRQLRTYDARKGAGRNYLTIRSLALSPDGRTLAVGCHEQGKDDTIRILDAADGRERARLKGHQHTVHSLAHLPDGRLVSGGEDGAIRIWDPVRGKELRKFDAGHKKFRCLAVTADGKTMASSGADGPVQIRDVATGERRHELKGGKERMDWLAFAPDGRTLLATGWSDTLFVWDVVAGRLIRRHDRQAADVAGPVAFSSDGERYACGGCMRHLTLWKTATGQELHCFTAHEDGGVIHSLGFAADGRSLLSGATDGTVRVWNPTTGKELHARRGHGDAVRAALFTPDGRTVVTGSDDSTLRVWDAATGELLRTKDYTYYFKIPHTSGKVHVGRNGAPVDSLAYSPDGRRLAVAGGSGVSFIDPKTLKTIGHVRRPHPERMFGGRLAFGPDGRTLAVEMSNSENRHHYVALVDAAAGKVRFECPGGKKILSAVAYSPDGKLLASCDYGSSGMVRLWDAETGKAARQIRSRNKYTVALAFALDGKTLAVGGNRQDDNEANFIELWNPETGKAQGAVEVGKHTVYAIAYSPDGKTLAAAASDHAVHLWEVATGRPRGRFAGHLGWIRTLSFAPDGRALVTGSTDTTALVWDLTGGRRTARPLTDEQWRAAWADLGSDDAVKSYRAMWALAAAGQTVAELRAKLKPLTAAEAVKIVRRVEDLDSDDFKVRQQASAALQKLGRLAGPALRQALQGKPTPEARMRGEELLKQLPPRSAERLRELRAVEALGHIAGPEARRLLEALAAGPGVDRLTHDARAILEGWKRRPGVRAHQEK